MIQRSSQFSKKILELCRKICDHCAAECTKHGYTHCKKCADACLRFAEECGKVSC
ncbi:four-helix bundle copper-binding protein [Heyndrickxia acidicola]|uniref:Four-helix bundle copper-binding protein n=1 Tax=Heyndrickxia acidicola TaxID=209389 RepID=A0ABU6MLL0_9BACI|nr:four-helix bundle copper-binding protein [Heyndrickxia acidicola]MED1205400.1 four-helix bundle copper-binding protein [Heyndrickxia acidicola]